MQHSLMSPFGLKVMEVIAIQPFIWSAIIILDVTVGGLVCLYVSAILSGVLNNLCFIMGWDFVESRIWMNALLRQ